MNTPGCSEANLGCLPHEAVMNDILREKIDREHAHLKTQFEAFIAKEITAADLKHDAAPFGIYQQRDGKFMCRVRITGGELSVAQFRTIQHLMEKYGVEFLHLTTRQDIQLHGTPAESVHGLIADCTDAGLIFRGGGGNTYRNIAVSPESGICASTVFDVMPYAKAANEFLVSYENAFKLPRKFKAAFSCSDYDSAMATIQDLGFIATIKDGKKGFKVYLGGGLGREPITAMKVIDFLPEADVACCFTAAIDMFYGHGNRENRNFARLRFLRKDLGDDPFKALFMEYFEKAETAPLKVKDSVNYTEKLTKLESEPPASTDYIYWQIRSNYPTPYSTDISSVVLYVPEGNLTAPQLKQLLDAIEETGCQQIRMSAQQNLILPAVDQSVLGTLFTFLQSFEPDLTGHSFVGQLQSCIGSNFCKIGILDAPGIADKVGAALDAEFHDRPEIQAENFHRIQKQIRLSGCPNSCGAHQAADLGLQGFRQRIDGELTDVFKVFTGGAVKAGGSTLGASNEEYIEAKDAPEFVAAYLEKLL